MDHADDATASGSHFPQLLRRQARWHHVHAPGTGTTRHAATHAHRWTAQRTATHNTQQRNHRAHDVVLRCNVVRDNAHALTDVHQRRPGVWAPVLCPPIAANQRPVLLSSHQHDYASHVRASPTRRILAQTILVGAGAGRFGDRLIRRQEVHVASDVVIHTIPDA